MKVRVTRPDGSRFIGEATFPPRVGHPFKTTSRGRTKTTKPVEQVLPEGKFVIDGKAWTVQIIGPDAAKLRMIVQRRAAG